MLLLRAKAWLSVAVLRSPDEARHQNQLFTGLYLPVGKSTSMCGEMASDDAASTAPAHISSGDDGVADSLSSAGETRPQCVDGGWFGRRQWPQQRLRLGLLVPRMCSGAERPGANSSALPPDRVSPSRGIWQFEDAYPLGAIQGQALGDCLDVLVPPDVVWATAQRRRRSGTRRAQVATSWRRRRCESEETQAANALDPFFSPLAMQIVWLAASAFYQIGSPSGQHRRGGVEKFPLPSGGILLELGQH